MPTLMAFWVVGSSAQAQVPSVDPYRVSATVAGVFRLQVDGQAGAVPPSSTVTIINTASGATVSPVIPAPDGSFIGQISGVRSNGLSVFVVDSQGNAGAPTVVYAGALTIKNPYQPGSVWRVGQAHTHTTNSDGVNSPAELESAYHAAGFDFVVSTDHRGWPSPLYTAIDDGMTPDPVTGGGNDLFWIRGAEIGNANVHLGSWGTSSNVALNSITDTQQAINATRSLGGIAVINHPENEEPPYSWEWHEDILPVTDYSLIEAFNGKHSSEGTVESHIVDAIDLADEFQQVWWVGTDDCHDVNDPEQFNRYAIVVQADTPTMSQADLMAAADAGRLYLRQTAQGPAISQVITRGNTVEIALADVASNYQVSWYKRGGELAQRDLSVNTTATYAVQGAEGYVRAEVTRLSDGKRAYTQPLFIANGKDLAVSASNAALVDNDSTTIWDAGAATGSFVVDTGSVRSLNAIRIDWDGADGRRFNYEVEVSDTGQFAGEQRRVTRRTYSNRLAPTLDFFDAWSRFVRFVIVGQSAGGPASARVREVEVFASSPARTNLYIDNVSGDDANTGLVASPWRTFAHARSRVRPRDTLNFLQNAVPYPGSMQVENLQGGKHAAATVQYRGANGVPARVDANGHDYGITISGVQWVEWNDFDISLATNANLFISNVANVEIRRNRLHDANGRGVLAAGDFTLAYNLIYGNGTDGVTLYTDGTNGKVFNNVLYGNGMDGLAIGNAGIVNATIQNNIVAANGRFAFFRDPNGVVLDSHNCGTGFYAGFWGQAGNVPANPNFTDSASRDFTLQLGSPCIDAGIDLNYNADFDGEPIGDVLSVPDTGSPGAYSRTYTDMGAHEACDTCNSGGGGCHQ